jgi:pentatricopeptide repeat protein
VLARELAAKASARRRSCGGGFLREMQERDGIDPDYATVISGWCKSGRIEDVARVFDEMLARVLKNARVLLLDEASRVQNAVEQMLQRRAGQRRAGRTHAVREELQCSGCGRIRTGVVGLRVENVGGR